MPKSCRELVDIYNSVCRYIKDEKLKFTGIEGKDVYNITAPFEIKGEKIIAGRVESRDSENSKTVFFVKSDDGWVPRKNTAVYDLQDPFITRINDEIVFGGVETFPHPEIVGALGYRTVFYRGNDIDNLEKFAKGPDMMKDIRIIRLPKGSIGVFTRPQGKIGGRGKIGFIEINSLDNLNADTINSACLINGQFIDEEWGGTNELHILKNGLIGIVGHIACFDDEGNRHYYSMVFTFDTVSRIASDIKIIAVRSDLMKGDAKRPDLVDVLFSGGLIRRNDGRAELYLGVSDAEAHMAIIDDPFLEYER